MKKVALLLIAGALSWAAGRYLGDDPKPLTQSFADSAPPSEASSLSDSFGESNSSLKSLSRNSQLSVVQKAEPQMAAYGATDTASGNGDASSAVSFEVSYNPLTKETILLPKQFAAEAVDYSWAQNQERMLLDGISTDEAFRDYDLGGVVCKTSVCQVNFNLNANKSQKFEIGGKLMRYLRTSGSADSQNNIMVLPGDKEGFTSFYLKFPRTEN